MVLMEAIIILFGLSGWWNCCKKNVEICRESKRWLHHSCRNKNQVQSLECNQYLNQGYYNPLCQKIHKSSWVLDLFQR